jgi:hypothetical protein
MRTFGFLAEVMKWRVMCILVMPVALETQIKVQVLLAFPTHTSYMLGPREVRTALLLQSVDSVEDGD